MNHLKPKNSIESIKQRLKNLAIKQGEDPGALFHYYVMERFLYRISMSTNAHFFILKGALMLRVLGGSLSRATRDIDFQSDNFDSPEQTVQAIRECLLESKSEDGVTFDSNNIQATQIQLDTRDRGVRIEVQGYIGTSRYKIQVDVGSGGTIIPKPTWIYYPALLEFDSPKLLGYPKESIVADKFEAMVSRDLTNSRVKDFYDIWILSEAEIFHENILREAIQSTFLYYETTIPHEKPICLTQAYWNAAGQERRWHGFLKNAQIKLDLSLEQVAQRIECFLMPICDSIQQQITDTNRLWSPSGPWLKNGNP